MNKIKEIKIYPAKIPRKYPFRTSQATQYTVDGIFVEVKDESGYVGTGEAAPREHVTGETFENTFQEIDVLSNQILGKKPKYIPEANLLPLKFVPFQIKSSWVPIFKLILLL